jgi:ATP-dependent exoDNAse (exonuclease V) beta subunit
VLTVHSAKGLEFGHVYLIETHARAGGPDKPELDIDERWASRNRLDYTLFRASTPGFCQVREERDRVEAAERVRTLYVALTRARERLVLVGRWRPKPKPRAPEACETFGDLLGSRRDLPDDLEQLASQATDGRIDRGGARWVFLEPDREEIAAPFEPAAGLDADRIDRDERALGRRRRAARKRMELPLGRAASQEAAARLEQVVAGGGDGEIASRDVALQVGVAIHRMLETWRLDEEPGAEMNRARTRVASDLGVALPDALVPSALERAEALLERIERGSLLQRLYEIGPSVLGREVPVLLPADDGAAGFVSGALDLIYADPESGRLTIVDFKTDRVDDEEAIAERAAAYSLQEELYARAVHLAFGLDEAPATELWFLWPDRLSRSPSAGTG